MRWYDPDTSWRPRACPACESIGSKLIFFKENVPYHECLVCRCAFVNPLPPTQLLLSLYNDVWSDYFRSESKISRDFDPGRYWRELAVIRPAWRTGRLLDVGCATGSFLAAAKQLGFASANGIDIADEAVSYANQRTGGAICGDFLAQPYAAESFDVVTLWATLEHVDYPASFIREAHRVLAPGGVLCVSVPNWSGVSMRTLGASCHMVGLEHLNYFTPGSLSLLLERCGFRVAVKHTRGFNPLSFWSDRRGRHLLGPWGESQMESEGARNADLRRNPLVRFAEIAVDTLVRASRTGDLLLVAARKE